MLEFLNTKIRKVGKWNYVIVNDMYYMIRTWPEDIRTGWYGLEIIKKEFIEHGCSLLADLVTMEDNPSYKYIKNLKTGKIDRFQSGIQTIYSLPKSKTEDAILQEFSEFPEIAQEYGMLNLRKNEEKIPLQHVFKKFYHDFK